MKKFLSLVLVFCMLAVFASCTPKDSGNQLDTPGGNTPGGSDGWQDSIGERDFGGDEFVISCRADYDYEIYADEDSKETIDHLIYNRNKLLEERFHASIVPLSTVAINETAQYDYVQKALNRGESEFDLIVMFAYQSGKLILPAYYYDWRQDVPYCRDSIKGEKDWWPSGINRDCTVSGRQYVAVSDMSITAIEKAWAIAFNKQMAEDNNIAAKLNAQTLYEVVDRGDWTIDNLVSLTKDFWKDSEIGQRGQRDEEDTYGMFLPGGTGVDAFAFSFGFHYLENDGVNYPELWTVTNRTVTAITKLRDFANSAGMWYDITWDYAKQNAFFAEGHALFAARALEQLASDALHNMEDEFGVLPYPKLDTTQKVYKTGTEDHYSVLSVPIICHNMELAGAMTEAMSAYNNKNVKDLYYRTIVTHRNTCDEDSVRMIDLIMDGRTYDLTTYHYNELKCSDEPNGALGLFFRYMVWPNNRNKDITSYWASGNDALGKALDALIIEYDAIAKIGT